MFKQILLVAMYMGNSDLYWGPIVIVYGIPRGWINHIGILNYLGGFVAPALLVLSLRGAVLLGRLFLLPLIRSIGRRGGFRRLLRMDRIHGALNGGGSDRIRTC